MNTNYDSQQNPTAGQPSILQSLLSNPAAISAILSLIKPKTEATPAAAPAGLFNTQSAQSGGIGQLLSNPAFLQQLPTLLTALGPLLGQQNAPPAVETSSVVAHDPERDNQTLPAGDNNSVLAGNFNPSPLRGGEPLSALIPYLSSYSPAPFGVTDRRKALLLALKPFVGQERGDAIDYIIKVTELTEMFRKH
ncbi:MAG: hypothetical protein GX303_08905 [Clostridiales bacterium]|nr:hypothetical protein [Clostridiales bacterium]